MKFKSVLTSFLVVHSSSIFADENPVQAQIARLERKRAFAMEQLQRTENGMNPCYTDACQRKKFSLMATIYQQSELVPARFLQTRKDGVATGYQLIRKKFQPPVMKSEFPSSVHEWSLWWAKRYNHEEEIRSQWAHFASDASLVFNGLELYRKISNASQEQRDLIQAAWDRGLYTATKHLIAQATYARDVGVFKNKKDKVNEEKALKLAVEEMQKFDEVNSREFDGQYHNLLLKLFPQASKEEQVTSFLILMADWMDQTGIRDLFDENYRDELLQRDVQSENLQRSIQKFEDLEYGVVGLKNFYSPVNRAVAIEAEIPLQEYLDKVDGVGRYIVDIGASYFTVVTGRALFGIGYISEMLLPMISNLFQIHTHLDYSDKLWDKSTRTEDLKGQLEKLEEKMEGRREELFKNRAQLKSILLQIDSEISRLKGGNQK